MNAIWSFTTLSYALAVALSLFIGLTGGVHSRYLGLAYLSMGLPAIACLVVYLITGEGPRVRWDRFRARYLPVALLLIPCVLHAAMLPMSMWLEGPLRWKDWLTRQSDALYHTQNWGAVTTGGLVGHLALNATVGLIVVSFLAFFEEIGWRAWLLPRLADRMGARRAVVVTSIIWALWHVPFFVSGILQVDNIPTGKLLLVVPIGTLGAGLVLGWLWLRSESIWLVSIAHGALNNWGQYAFKFMKDTTSPDKDVVVLASGSLAVLVVGMVLLRQVRTPEPEITSES